MIIISRMKLSISVNVYIDTQFVLSDFTLQESAFDCLGSLIQNYMGDIDLPFGFYRIKFNKNSLIERNMLKSSFILMDTNYI